MSTAGSPAQALEVPAGPEQVTPEWLTAALRTRDQQHPAVAALDWEPVSDGLGFAGRVVRLKLRYGHGAPDAGKSMIGKFAAPLASARELLNDFGGYEREVRFYAELAGNTGLPAPACYYHAYDPRNGTFVLLLEDLAASRLGDQVTGASYEEAEFVVSHLARFHARWWSDASLLELPWAQPSRAAIEKLPDLFERGLGPLRETMTGRFDDVMRLVQRLRPLVPELAQMYGSQFPPRPYTLVHGDMRMDNLFFPVEGRGRFAVVDWQGAAIGSPGNELAYFLILSLPVAVRRQHEASLIARYHSELVAYGVRDYPLQALKRDYDRGILIQLLGLPVLSGNLDFSSERGQALATAALERLSAAAADLKAARIITVLTWVLRLQRLGRAIRRRLPSMRRRG